MNNTVTVSIYGQEFTVGGDKPAEQIIRRGFRKPLINIRIRIIMRSTTQDVSML